MLTIKEYAENKGCSYEAVRKQINRYRNDLQEHIIKVGRTQYLDDEAVLFLDNKRADNPIIVMESGKDEELKRLETENKALLVKIAELQEALLQEKEQVKVLQEDKIRLLEQRDVADPEIQEPERKWWEFWK